MAHRLLADVMNEDVSSRYHLELQSLSFYFSYGLKKTCSIVGGYELQQLIPTYESVTD